MANYSNYQMQLFLNNLNQRTREVETQLEFAKKALQVIAKAHQEGSRAFLIESAQSALNQLDGKGQK